MNSQRLRQLRLARGMSLEELAAALGGIVTRQALWKYEKGTANPSLAVANKLASVLKTKTVHLIQDPTIRVDFIAYRKGSGLTKTEQERVESLVCLALEERVRLQERIRLEDGLALSTQQKKVTSLEEAEQAANALRKEWKLGADALANVIAILEDHFVHVIEIDADPKFDGISAFARDAENNIIAAAVVIRRGIPGERQRMDLAHELAHLVLLVSSEVDEERAAFRFAGAFLLPAEALVREIGTKRDRISEKELLILKQRFGVSMQALLFRMHDLKIINDAYYKKWCIAISTKGYRKAEPNPLEPEHPQWLQRSVLRGISEEFITLEEAKSFLGESVPVDDTSLSLTERRAFMKLPLADRRRILEEQAEKMVSYYEEHTEWKEIGGGDIIEY